MHALRIEEGEKEEKKGKIGSTQARFSSSLLLTYSSPPAMPLLYTRAYFSFLFLPFSSLAYFFHHRYILLTTHTHSYFCFSVSRDGPTRRALGIIATVQCFSQEPFFSHPIYTYLSIWDHSLLRIGFIALV